MRCSTCSEVVRPVVAFDIDGTLGDYHGHLAAFATAYLGAPHVPEEESIYDGSLPYREWFCETFGVDTTTFRAVKLAYRQGGLKRMMPLFAGARELVNGLRSRAEVWLTTTRPWEKFDRVDPDTRFWLERHGIEFDGLIYDEDAKMEALAERVDPERVCFVLDDLVLNLVEGDAYFPSGSTVLLRTPYNEAGPLWSLMTGSLLGARAMATVHAQDWMVAHSFDGLPTTSEGDQR